jgi:hypothetical protein
MTIGDNYIESKGQRVEFDEMFVRESNGEKYLIMKKGNEEQALKIIDGNTLQQDMGMMKITFTRV